MYGILGEDESDAHTLKVLVKRLSGSQSLKIRTRGYGGSGEMLRKGARQLQLFQRLRARYFVICHDADSPDPRQKRELVIQRIVRPSGLHDSCCVVIPVHELEAWILADIECASEIFPSWKPSPVQCPETIPKPKEYIERLSRDSNQRPRYSHAVHNEKMAMHVNLLKVARKCPSFRELQAFVTKSK